MNPRIIEIDGKEFVSGLFWLPANTSQRKELQKEIKLQAKDLRMDLHVVRTTSTASSLGFCSTNTGLKPGVFSVAAMISKSLEVKYGATDFIFVARLPDNSGWIYVAQKDGIIISDGDRVYESDDEARTKVLQDRSLGTWKSLFVPEIWGIDRSTEVSFESLLPRSTKGKLKIHKWWRLMPVDAHKAVSLHLSKILIAAAVIGAGFYGFQQFKAYQLKMAIEEAQRIAALEATPQGQLVPVHPWKSIPLASDLVRECMNALATVPLFPGNWEVAALNCNSSAFTITWRPKQYGWIQHLKAVIPDVVIALDGSVASKTIPLPPISAENDEPLHTQNERLVAMYSASQRYGVNFTATPPAPSAPQLPGQNANIAPKDWQEIGWAADKVTMPAVVLTALEGQGFRMTNMTGQVANGLINWKMEGTQYVQP
jgi:hypothetical protein